MNRDLIKYQLDDLKNDLLFGLFKDIILVESYPFSYELENLLPLNQYGENILLGINDPHKYWVLVKKGENNNKFPGVTVTCDTKTTITISKDSHPSIIVEYKTEEMQEKSQKLLLITPEHLDLYSRNSMNMGILEHPQLPTDDKELLIHCLRGEKVVMQEITDFPYTTEFKFSSVDKETCHKERGKLFRSIIDIKGNEKYALGKIFEINFPGVSINTRERYLSDIITNIKITEDASLPLLIIVTNIDYRVEFDSYYGEFNKSKRETYHYVFYNWDRLQVDLKWAIKDKNFAAVENYIAPLFNHISDK